jgi:hypothetical protein
MKNTQTMDFKTFKSYVSEIGIRYRKFFENGYGVSIISTQFTYGGSRGLWELAVIKGDDNNWEICYDTTITNDVLGYLTESEVNDACKEVSELQNLN